MRHDSWSLEPLEPPMLFDESSDVVTLMPEIRRRLAHDRHDDDLGLWALLEHPDALARRRRRSLGAA